LLEAQRLYINRGNSFSLSGSYRLYQKCVIFLAIRTTLEDSDSCMKRRLIPSTGSKTILGRLAHWRCTSCRVFLVVARRLLGSNFLKKDKAKRPFGLVTFSRITAAFLEPLILLYASVYSMGRGRPTPES